MNLNYKLFFKYILFYTNQIFFKYLYKNNKNTNICITENNFYFLSLHLKLSSLFYSTQLSDIFGYELPIAKNEKNNGTIPLTNTSIIVYNFHNILFQQRFFIFVVLNQKKNINKNNTN
jgi:hypothetical protein